MISDEKYKKALEAKQKAEAVLSEFYRQKAKKFETRLQTNPVFIDNELVYAAHARCPCGYGLAYPNSCGPNHYWDCAGILLGKVDTSIEHSGKLPFAFYEIKSEAQPSANGATTRGSVEPKHD